MKIISFIDELLLIRRILEHLGLCQEIIPKGLPPPKEQEDIAEVVVCEALLLFLKDKTGGSRPARRHAFVWQQKYAKAPAPCGEHLLCQFFETSNDDGA